MVESTIGMFGMFAGLAMGSTMTKFIAEFKINDAARAGRILSLARTLSLLAAAIVAVGLFFSSPWLAEKSLNRPEIASVLRIGALLLFVSTISNVEIGSLAGFEAFKEVARINIIQGITIPIVTIPTVYFCGLPGAIASLVIIESIGYLIASAAVNERCRVFGIPKKYFDTSALAERNVIWRFSIPSTISGILVIPVVWLTNTLLVNQPSGYGELGLFNAANQWRQFVIIIPNILGTVMMPILSEAYGSGNDQEFRQAITINLEITWVIALPATVVAIGFSKLLASFFGSQYLGAVPIIALLVLSAFLNTVNNVVGTTLASSGRMWTGTFFNLAWAISLIFATVVFAPIYGGMGLALAYLIAYTLHSVWQMAYVDKKLAPMCITRQKKLIGFSLITLIPIYFLGINEQASYVFNVGIVLISLIPLAEMAWKFKKGRNSTLVSSL
jgi:O-antigen/teichoic acid export membrane protein